MTGKVSVLFSAEADDRVLSEALIHEAYLDDVVICSESWSQHMEHLCAVFCCLKEAGLTTTCPNVSLGKPLRRILGK